ncbi:histidine-rich glycoprotein-like [Eriocheir sinensis]|uniref:histidine-rich glycoprotein-like n=1 Tax=Eriocheir sinensis TaxID=95602 RepID=UPI0021C59880|nr:histidine-rich glycoprotein-like [Eriocheir sinensis]
MARVWCVSGAALQLRGQRTCIPGVWREQLYGSSLVPPSAALGDDSMALHSHHPASHTSATTMKPYHIPLLQTLTLLGHTSQPHLYIILRSHTPHTLIAGTHTTQSSSHTSATAMKPHHHVTVPSKPRATPHTSLFHHHTTPHCHSPEATPHTMLFYPHTATSHTSHPHLTATARSHTTHDAVLPSHSHTSPPQLEVTPHTTLFYPHIATPHRHSHEDTTHTTLFYSHTATPIPQPRRHTTHDAPFDIINITIQPATSHHQDHMKPHHTHH